MKKYALFAALLPLSISAGAFAATPVEVTRFHIGNPAQSGSIAVEEMAGNPDISLEFRTYAGIVERQLQTIGFSPSQTGSTSDYVALVSLSRSFRPSGVDRSGKPVSVGMGGAVGSRGYSGLGLGIGINLSKKPKDIVTTELSIQIRQRSDSTTIWEGRAITEGREGKPDAQPVAAVQKLSAALLGGYPGESGRTIKVK